MPNHAETIQQRDGVAVIVYEKPQCVQCTPTKQLLDRARIAYARVDVTEDPEALDFIKSLGYMAAPVVWVSTTEGEITWSGLQPDLIKKHITHRADAT